MEYRDKVFISDTVSVRMNYVQMDPTVNWADIDIKTKLIYGWSTYILQQFNF